LFGTHYQPRGRWPAAYGIAGGEVMPDGFWRQLLYPLRRT
jgi:hypothetical protein